MCDGAWVNRTPRRVSRTGVNRSTPGDFCNSVSVKHARSSVLIVRVTPFPPCGLRGSLQVVKKRQSASPGLGRNTQELDAVVDVKLPNDLDSVSIFSKMICHKLSDGSSGELYLGCRMNFVNDPVQTQDPHFMDMGLYAINTLNESCFLGSPTTRIRRPTGGYHWSAPDHVFGEATAVVMSAAKSDHEYN